jgi:hypothetical protein
MARSSRSGVREGIGAGSYSAAGVKSTAPSVPSMVNAFLVVVMAGDVFVGRKLVIPDSRPTPVTRPQCVRKRLVGYFGTGDIGGPDKHGLLPGVTRDLRALPLDTPRMRARFPGTDREGFEPSIRF